MFRIKYCREAVLKLLYHADVLDSDSQFTAEQLFNNDSLFFKEINRVEQKYILKIVQRVMDDKKQIDRLISRNLIGWKLERLMPVDRALIRMGVAESYYNDKKAVIIDDIIRMAKKYGGEESYKIINAILDKVIA